VSTATRGTEPARAPQDGRSRQKLRTRRHILAAASSLIATGQRPTVAEAADAADVSRRTAYRYFPTQAKLLTEAALEGLRLPMEAALAEMTGGGTRGNVEARVTTLIDKMQVLAISHEQLLRTMIHETVLEGTGSAPIRRGTRRIAWLEAAVQPVRTRLTAKAYDRLVSALALCGGIEALLVLRDIRGLSERDAIDVSCWAARAIVRQALREPDAGRPPARHGAKSTAMPALPRRKRRH
jgi:AcrR family transcriptional regulator